MSPKINGTEITELTVWAKYVLKELEEQKKEISDLAKELSLHLTAAAVNGADVQAALIDKINKAEVRVTAKINEISNELHSRITDEKEKIVNNSSTRDTNLTARITKEKEKLVNDITKLENDLTKVIAEATARSKVWGIVIAVITIGINITIALFTFIQLFKQ